MKPGRAKAAYYYCHHHLIPNGGIGYISAESKCLGQAEVESGTESYHRNLQSKVDRLGA